MNWLAYKLAHVLERLGAWAYHTSQDLQWWADHREHYSENE